MNTDTARHIVAVHVGSYVMNALAMDFPGDNQIGGMLLLRLLRLAFLRDGIGILSPPGRVGPLNDCILTFVVEDHEAAIKTIKAELKSVLLLECCQIGIGAGDGSFRCIYPSPKVNMRWLLDQERQELFTSQRNQFTEELLRKIMGETGDKK